MFLNFFDVISIFYRTFFDVSFLCLVFLCFVFSVFLPSYVLSFYVSTVLVCFGNGIHCNVCEALICKLVYLFIVFGEHGRYIGNINHLW